MKKAKKIKHSRLQQNPSTGMPQRAFRIQSNRSVVFPALSYGISPFGFPELRILSLSSFWNHTNTHTHTLYPSLVWCLFHGFDSFFGERWGTFPTLGGHVFVTFRLRSFFLLLLLLLLPHFLLPTNLTAQFCAQKLNWILA